MKRLLVLMLLALSIVATGLPASTQAGELYQRQYKGLNANALFSSYDSTGCIFTGVAVRVNEGRLKEAGQPGTLAEVLINMGQINACRGTMLLDAWGWANIAPGDSEANKELTMAALNTRVEVFDYVSETVMPVDINLSWTGSGATVRKQWDLQSRVGGFLLRDRSDATVREATASGTVSLLIGSRNLNLTPEPAVPSPLTYIASAKLGHMTISR